MAMSSKTNPVTWFEIPVNDIQAPGRTPSKTGTVVFFDVPNIDSTLGAVVRNGGKVVMPKASGGEHGSIAQFEDSEGNLVSLFSNS